MSSGVLDGDFYGHPKAIHAWGLHHSSIGVWALGVSYAHKNSTGGIVSAAFVIEKLPAKRATRPAARPPKSPPAL